MNDEHKLYMKKYREDNKDKIKESKKQYRENNKDKIKEYQKEYQKDYWANRSKVDPFFKLTKYIRSRTTNAVRLYSLSKNNSTMKMLGCDKNTLMEHLQKTGEQYDSNFNVYDYDSTLYHIDHIKTFEDVSKGIYTLDEVCHYTNLQILPSDINLSKGGNSW